MLLFLSTQSAQAVASPRRLAEVQRAPSLLRMQTKLEMASGQGPSLLSPKSPGSSGGGGGGESGGSEKPPMHQRIHSMWSRVDSLAAEDMPTVPKNFGPCEAFSSRSAIHVPNACLCVSEPSEPLAQRWKMGFCLGPACQSAPADKQRYCVAHRAFNASAQASIDTW
jgi:hypothetical protein